MYNRRFSLVLLCLALCLTLSCVAEAELEADVFRYRLTERGHAVITAYLRKDDPDLQELVLPGELAGHPLSGIDDGAFEGAAHVKSLTLHSGVYLLAPYALDGMDQAVVKAPMNSAAAAWLTAQNRIRVHLLPEASPALAEYEEGGFRYVILPDDTVRITGFIGETDELVVPERLPFNEKRIVEIGENAFAGAGYPGQGSLRVTLPEGLRHLGPLSLGSMDLSGVYLPASLVSIEGNPFCYNTDTYIPEISPDNPHYVYENKMLIDRRTQTVVAYLASLMSGETWPVVPEGILHIGPNAFSQHPIMGIDLPASLRSIGDEAFLLCTSLIDVQLPPGLETIGDRAFAQCWEMAAPTFPDSLRHIGTEAFKECRGLGLEPIRLPDQLYSLGKDAFRDAGLQELVLPRGLERLAGNPGIGAPDGEGRFALRVDPGNPHFYVDQGALYDRRSATLLLLLEDKQGQDFVLPEGTRAVAPFAFQAAQPPSTVSLPGSLEALGTSAMEGVTGRVDLPAAVSFLGDAPFGTGLDYLRFPDAMPYLAQPHEYGYELSLARQIGAAPDSESYRVLQQMGVRNLLADADTLRHADGFLYRLNEAGEAVLHKAEGLTGPRLVIPGQLEGIPVAEIADSLNLSCDGAELLEIQAPIRRIGSKAFRRCGSLHTLLLPDTLEAVADEAFEGLRIGPVPLPDGLSQMTAASFGDLGPNPGYAVRQGSPVHALLTEQQLPIQRFILPGERRSDTGFDYLLDEQGRAIIVSSGLRGLPGLTIPAELDGHPVAAIAAQADLDIGFCSSLTFEPSILAIGQGAFSRSNMLQELRLPEGLQQVDALAFQLQNTYQVVLPGSLQLIATNAFGDAAALGEVVFVAPPGSYAEQWVKAQGLSLTPNLQAEAEQDYLHRLLEDGTAAITGYAGPPRTTLRIPARIAGADVSEIAADANISLAGVSQLEIPAPIRRIGSRAFTPSDSLRYLSLPESLLVIEELAFQELDHMVIPLPGSAIQIDPQAFGWVEHMRGYTYSAPPGSVAEQWVKSQGYDLVPAAEADPFAWLNP